jgi:hypothetical protein
MARPLASQCGIAAQTSSRPRLLQAIYLLFFRTLGALFFTLIVLLAVASATDITTPQKEKEWRTAAQAKLDSHIVLALKKSRGEPPFDKPTRLDPDLTIEPDGRVLVDLNATVSKELLARIESEGGKIINSFETVRAIRALVPLGRIEVLASRPDIQFIAPAVRATTNRGDAAQSSGAKP